jgi:hypothetical protein
MDSWAVKTVKQIFMIFAADVRGVIMSLRARTNRIQISKEGVAHEGGLIDEDYIPSAGFEVLR